jgi:hypothetical protein
MRKIQGKQWCWGNPVLSKWQKSKAANAASLVREATAFGCGYSETD